MEPRTRVQISRDCAAIVGSTQEVFVITPNQLTNDVGSGSKCRLGDTHCEAIPSGPIQGIYPRGTGDCEQNPKIHGLRLTNANSPQSGFFAQISIG